MGNQNVPMMEMRVDPAMVEGILKREIQAAIVTQLGQAPNLISNVVNMALRQKVDNEGKLNSSTYYNTHELIDVLTNKAIREAATTAVQEWVQAQKPDIMKAIKANLSANKSKIVKQFVEAVDQAICPKFHISMNLTAPRE